MANQEQDSFDQREFLEWAEFGCWATLAMTPAIYWLQGPSVSKDQAVVRILLIALAMAGLAGIRIFNWRQNRKRAVMQTHSGSAGTNLEDPMAIATDEP